IERRGGGRGGGQRVGGDDVLQGTRQAGNHFLFVHRGGAEASGTGGETSRDGGALHGQFLCGAQLGRVQRRIVLLHPQGRALSDGAFDLFPHQHGEHGPVRADADRRGGRRVCELSRRLHGADAGREPIARGGGGVDRAGQEIGD